VAAWDIKGRDAFSATAGGGTAAGGTWNEGTWNVNLGGSGFALQSATGGAIPTWMIVAAVVGGLWLLTHK
jgi:hypothetical protein